MREAINAGAFYHVSVPHWASGGQDVAAESPAAAALLVGCQHVALFDGRGVAMRAEVFRHLSNSRIGAAVLESCGVFETLTATHFVI